MCLMVRQFANHWAKSNKASAALNSLPVYHEKNHYKSLSVSNNLFPCNSPVRRIPCDQANENFWILIECGKKLNKYHSPPSMLLMPGHSQELYTIILDLIWWQKSATKQWRSVPCMSAAWVSMLCRWRRRLTDGQCWTASHTYMCT